MMDILIILIIVVVIVGLLSYVTKSNIIGDLFEGIAEAADDFDFDDED